MLGREVTDIELVIYEKTLVMTQEKALAIFLLSLKKVGVKRRL